MHLQLVRVGVVWSLLSSPFAGKQDIVVTICVRCMCVRPSEFVRTITCTIMSGFQNNLA